MCVCVRMCARACIHLDPACRSPSADQPPTRPDPLNPLNPQPPQALPPQRALTLNPKPHMLLFARPNLGLWGGGVAWVLCLTCGLRGGGVAGWPGCSALPVAFRLIFYKETFSLLGGLGFTLPGGLPVLSVTPASSF